MVKLLTLIILVSCVFTGCGIQFEINVHGDSKIVKANDGYPIISYELKSNAIEVSKRNPKAVFFYIQGSEYETVLNRTGMLVSAVLLGGRMIVYEKRGVVYDKVNLDTCFKYSSKQIRIDDGLKVVN